MTILLRTIRLTKAFGSLVVTKDVNLEVRAGERHALIGPNGAGKTSLIHQIGGQLRPSSGQILLRDADITGASPERICQLGVGRTFQRNNLFRSLSVRENVRLAVQAKRGTLYDPLSSIDANRGLWERVDEILALLRLTEGLDRPVNVLSYGEQRQLEIALALATEPALLLLDEPTSGMSPAETTGMIDLVASLPTDARVADDRARHERRVHARRSRYRALLRRDPRLGNAAGDLEQLEGAGRLPGSPTLMLELEGVHAYYGDSHVLHGVSLAIREGEVVSLLGRNGAGKTTTILTIMGYLKPRPGRIVYGGSSISGLAPYQIARRGFGFVPQERGIFPSLTVKENLTVAARQAGGGRWNLASVFKLFPRLEERSGNLGFQLSGGEQQMLSIARALMLNPALLLLDEPSEGLAPLIVEEIVVTLKTLKVEGLAVLLVEQALQVALDLADRHYVLSKGEICFTGTGSELEGNEQVLKTHLSV